MRPASPQMSSLPVLPLFLVLLALHAPQAQGQPLRTYSKLIKEIEAILNEPPVPAQDPLGSNEKFILRNKSFLKINLETFLNASNSFTERGNKIRTILEEFRTVLPTPTSTEDPISIEMGNWGDFRRKLNEYLFALKNWIRY